MEKEKFGLTPDGKEINDPTPLYISMPREETIEDRIKRIIRVEASRRAAEAGLETWEEANDFDIVDDFESGIDDTKYAYVEPEYMEKIPAQAQGVPDKPLEPVEEPPEPDQAGGNDAST